MSRLLALGCADSIARMTPTTRQHRKPKNVHSLWVSLGWLAFALSAAAYVAAFAN